jgi:hypothetical protein
MSSKRKEIQVEQQCSLAPGLSRRERKAKGGGVVRRGEQRTGEFKPPDEAL